MKAKIDWLRAQGWHGLRRTRGDGDCFYRCELVQPELERRLIDRHFSCIAFAYAYVERLMHAEDLGLAVATARSILTRTLPLLELAGFEKMVVSTIGTHYRLTPPHVISNHLSTRTSTKPLPILSTGWQDLTWTTRLSTSRTCLRSSRLPNVSEWLLTPHTVERGN